MSSCNYAARKLRQLREKVADKFLSRAHKLSRLVNLGERDGEDALKVMDIMIQNPEFMKQLASIVLDPQKHHHQKFTGF